MKFGDVVIYKEFGREFPALVLSSRELEHHSGENGEPLINLVFVKEVKNGAGEVINVSGSSREAEALQFRHDIAHESHEFTDAAKEELTRKGLLPPGGEIPGGRYIEAAVIEEHDSSDNSEPVTVASTEGEALTGNGSEGAPAPAADASSAPASSDSGDAGDEAAAEDKPKETVQ
jgi:hypothetical protein